jgi:formamidopyrimidine-DNA glycosylase
MPELPEVETIRLGLQKYLVGHKIQDVDVRLKRIISGETKNITGAIIISVERFGKGLVINLDNGYSLAIHVKMTGQLIYRGVNAPKIIHLSTSKVGEDVPNKWTHVIFSLDSPRGEAGKSSTLFYNDLRQFGWIKILKTEDVQSLPFFKGLGPEPFKDLTPEVFESIIKAGNILIKVLLLDQKRIGGVGNIYANDALFNAGIDPRRKTKSLRDSEIKKLYSALLGVLKKGLETGGASELRFVNVLGEDGGYQKHFRIYGRGGKPCLICKTEVKKMFLGGRGTYFCEKCQR